MLKICFRFTWMGSANCKQSSFGQITCYTMCLKFEIKNEISYGGTFSQFLIRKWLQILVSPMILKSCYFSVAHHSQYPIFFFFYASFIKTHNILRKLYWAETAKCSPPMRKRCKMWPLVFRYTCRIMLFSFIFQ